MRYKFIDDLTSDVMYEAYGRSLKEVFENAAEALFTVICQIKKVEPKIEREVEVKGKDKEELMFNWLQELIGLVDIEEMFFSRFVIVEISETSLKANVYGENITPEKGETVVKAVTYYKYKFEEIEEGFKVNVSLDI